MDNGSMVDQFDPFITVTFDFPKDLNASYKRAIRNSIYNLSLRIGCKKTLSPNPSDQLSVEVSMSKFPFLIENNRHWYQLANVSWS